MAPPPAAYKLATLAPQHVVAAAVTLEAAFGYDSEYSWSRPLELPRDRFYGWLAHMYLPDRVAAKPASLVALAAEADDALAGVLTLEDMNAKDDAPAGEDAPPQPGMAAIEAILAECKSLFHSALQRRQDNRLSDAEAHAAQGVFGYFAFLGVGNAHRRRGVGAALVARGCDALRGDGFSWGVAFCTSHASAALFSGCGFERWGGVSYQEFALADGSHPFASLPKDECAVMVRRLRE